MKQSITGLFLVLLVSNQAGAARVPVLPQVAPVQRDTPAEITHRGDASSPNASHIDAVTLRVERIRGAVYIVQAIWYHSSKGNAARLHFQLVSISDPSLRIRVRDHPINAPSERQQRGTYIVARFRCGPVQENYSHVKRAIIFDSDGERSNSVDFVVDCNLALTS